MTQKDLSAKVPLPIAFHIQGKRGNGTLTYAAREQQYVIIETGNPDQPLYLKHEDLPHITESEGGLLLDLPDETADEADRHESNPGRS